MPNLPNERANGKAVMVGSKILLFGGQDTLQTITTIDMYSFDNIDMIFKLTNFGTLINLCPSQLISKEYISIKRKNLEYTSLLSTKFFQNTTVTTWHLIFHKKMKKYSTRK